MAKKLFFSMFDELDFRRSKINCFCSIAQLRVPKWDVFFSLWPFECTRPRALKIFEIEFVTKP